MGEFILDLLLNGLQARIKRHILAAVGCEVVQIPDHLENIHTQSRAARLHERHAEESAAPQSAFQLRHEFQSLIVGCQQKLEAVISGLECRAKLFCGVLRERFDFLPGKELPQAFKQLNHLKAIRFGGPGIGLHFERIQYGYSAVLGEIFLGLGRFLQVAYLFFLQGLFLAGFLDLIDQFVNGHRFKQIIKATGRHPFQGGL